MNLRPYQQKLISDIFQYWKVGRKRVLLQSGTGTGKCLVKGTRVRMYSGLSMPVEDIQVGDLLMGDDGQPRRVLSLATGEQMCYDIIPVKGEKWGCNESHILSLKCVDSYGKSLERGKIYDICLRDYMELPRQKKDRLMQYRVTDQGIAFEHTAFQVVPRGIEQYYGFEIDGNRRFLLGDFTVTHNTVMFNHIAALAEKKGHRVLIVADRRELIMQAWKRLFEASGIHAGIIMSGVTPAYHLPVQIASVQTLNRRSFPPDINLVIIDECRGSVAPTYAPIFGQYKDAFFLGVDATPIRTNGQGFDHIYQELVHGPSIKDMELAGALVSANVKVNPINQSSLIQVKMIGGDYDEGQLARVMMGDGIMAGLVASKEKHAPGEKTICFAVNIEHSKAIVAKYNEAGIKALHVDGSFTIEDRNRAFKAFEHGDVEVLVNVGIATYGYDNPSITCVQLARPTKSLALYLQMVGRGARPFTSKDGVKKQFYTILDHANCRIEHGAPNADRKWSLRGKGKAAPSKEDKKVKMIFGDGKERVVSTRELPEDMEGVVLVDMSDAELEGLGRRQKFDKINYKRVRSSYQPMWAYFRFVQEVKDFTLEDLQYIEKKLNFKYGWASFKWKEKLEKEKRAAA